MNLTPLRDRYVLKPIKAEAKSAGGILLQENALEKPFTGEVVAVGEYRALPSGELEKPRLSLGQVVAYRKGAGTEIPCNDETYLVIHDDEIVCVIEGEEAHD